MLRSPGCCTINAQADGPPGIFWGDVIHHPVQLIRHDLPFAFDTDGLAACKVRKSTMAILSDKWIRRMAEQHGMIEPFEPGQVRSAPDGHRIVSYGTSSYGYDIRCAREFKVFTNIY